MKHRKVKAVSKTEESSLRQYTGSVLDDLTKADTDDAVVDLLVGSRKGFNFENARYYDVNNCPFDHAYFCVLRASSKPHVNAQPGYLVYKGTISDTLLIRGKAAWARYDSPEVIEDRDKQRWVHDLELEGRGWLDVPIVVGEHVLGLWALARPAIETPNSIELELIERIASVAALKIHAISQTRVNGLTSKIFKVRDKITSQTETLKSCLEDICRSLNARCVAYFSLDPINEVLEKSLEVLIRDGHFDILRAEGDKQYHLGQCLTGTAWMDASLQFIPDFAKLMIVKPELADPASIRLHERALKSKIVSVIYQKIDVPGAAPGLIRAINRSDKPSLEFTSEHKWILDRISYPFAQILGISDASERVAAIWDAFSKTLERLRIEGLDYTDIANAAQRIGFHTIVITVWRPDGTLSDFWTNNLPMRGSLENSKGSLSSPQVLQIEQSKAVRVALLPPDLRDLLVRHNIDSAYVVPTKQSLSERSEPEFILSIFPLTVTHPQLTRTSRDSERFSWQERPNMLTALDILGRIVGNVRELARNRSLLYLAEQAVGTIGHEMRSPVASLVNVAQEVCRQEGRLYEQLPKNFPLTTFVTDVDHRGRIYAKQFTSSSEVLSWLSNMDNKIEEYAVRARRVVDNAVRWARMAGRIIEMQLEKVSLPNILHDCILELQRDIEKKSSLQVVIKEGVQRVPPFVADSFLIHHLFMNLLDNAIKYSHNPGGLHKFEVTITAERQPSLVDINITNWGLGIDESDYDNIFSSFYRSSVRDRLHTVRGVGLGLSTCNKIVKLHNGNIKVKSVPTLKDPSRTLAKEGYLTTFTVRLPTTLNEGRIDVDTTKINL